MKLLFLLPLLPVLFANSLVHLGSGFNELLLSDVQPLGWTNCGTTSDIFLLETLVVKPENPTKGDKISIELSGQLREDVESDGTLTLNVKFGVLTIIKETRNFCEEIGNIPDVPHCPLKKGKLVIKKEEELPNNVPPGRYTVRVSGADNQNRPMFCVTGTFQIKA